MPKQYESEAVEKCRELYCKYGGQNVDAIEREMRKAGWPLWRKANLYDRGKYGTKTYREGWIDKYNFGLALETYNKMLVTSVGSDDQKLYIGIKTVRERLEKKVLDGNESDKERGHYFNAAKLEIEARRNLNLSQDNLETFVAGYGKQLKWAAEIDADLAKLLAKYTDRFAELAKAHYGRDEDEEFYDGTESREDESGGHPFSLLAGGKDR